MTTSIKHLSTDTFQPYGYIIAHDETLPQNFQIVLTENATVGWRLAVSKITRQSFTKISRHPNSMESFEPISGVTLLCVAPPDTPEQYEIFLLDQPVCLHKNIWHASLTLSTYSLVKICENNEVDSEEYELDGTVQVVVQKQ